MGVPETLLVLICVNPPALLNSEGQAMRI